MIIVNTNANSVVAIQTSKKAVKHNTVERKTCFLYESLFVITYSHVSQSMLRFSVQSKKQNFTAYFFFF